MPKDINEIILPIVSLEVASVMIRDRKTRLARSSAELAKYFKNTLDAMMAENPVLVGLLEKMVCAILEASGSQEQARMYLQGAIDVYEALRKQEESELLKNMGKITYQQQAQK